MERLDGVEHARVAPAVGRDGLVAEVFVVARAADDREPRLASLLAALERGDGDLPREHEEPVARGAGLVHVEDAPLGRD